MPTKHLFHFIIGACVELLVNGENIFRGIFFQDVQMQQVFAAYPALMPLINFLSLGCLYILC